MSQRQWEAPRMISEVHARHFDAKANSKPVNIQAMRVTRKGVRYEYDAPDKLGLTKDQSHKTITQPHWYAPPKTLPPPPDINLIGYGFGSFVVVGYLGSKRDKGRWLVKCTCGDYETRTSKSARSPANDMDCCERCRHTAQLKAMDAHSRGLTERCHSCDFMIRAPFRWVGIK